MPRRCSICDHDQRPDIDAALVGGLSNRAIARQFQVGRDALRRHRRAGHIADTLIRAADAAEVSKADDLLGQIRALQANALRILDRAELAGDLRTALRAIGEARRTIEVLFDVERRRQAAEGISGEELSLLIAGLIDIVRRHVPSRETRALMADEIRRLTKDGS